MTTLKENNGKEKIQSDVEPKNDGLNYTSNIKKSYIFHLFMGFHMISGILIPFFLTWGKLSFVELMILQGYFTIMIVIFEIPCGAIADKLSRKLSLFLGSLSTAFAVLVYSSTPNILIFLIGETLWAFGEALISGSNEALIYDTLRKMRKENEMSKIMAKNQSYFLVGIALSAPIGSLLTLFIPLPSIVRLMFLPFIGASLISLTLKEPNHDLEKKPERYLTTLKSGFKELKHNKILRILAFDLIMVQVFLFFIIWTYQLYLVKLAVPIIFFGFVAASMTLMQIVFANLIPKWEKSVKNRRKFLIIYTLIPGIGFILLALILFTPISIIILLIIVGLGFSRNIIFIRGINKQIETENRATVLSTINMITCIIRAILYPLIGLLVMWSLNYTFIILGIIIIILALLTRVKNEYL